MSVILGCDLAINHSGFVWLTDAGEVVKDLLVLPKSEGWQSRIRETGHEFMIALLSMVPDMAIIEEPDMQGIVGRTTGTMSKLTGATYYIAGICKAKNIPSLTIPVQRWKGSVPKDVVHNRLKEKYEYARRLRTEDDRVDALGIADWYFKSNLYRRS